MQCAGANGASILAHNHKVQLGRLGVIDASASLMRQPGTATKTSAHLLHTLLSLSVSKENQVGAPHPTGASAARRAACFKGRTWSKRAPLTPRALWFVI